MSISGLHQFERTIQTTNHWLNDVLKELETDDRQTAYHAVRAVLQTVRDRLTVDEATNLGAQLPLLLKGVYYEGWHTADKPNKDRSREAYVREIRERFHRNMDLDPQKAVRAVLTVLRQRLTEGEFETVWQVVPPELRALLPERERT